MTYTTKSISYDQRIHFFWSLVVIALLLASLYIYAVSATTINTAERKSLEEKRGILATQISEMEFKYIAQKNSVSIEVAYDYGFREVTDPTYVSRASVNSLSVNR